jgi:predicted dehydrogenase
MLKVALLGCGGIARLAHGPALRRLGGARVVALADADPGRLDGMQALFPGARGHADWRAALDQPEVDAAVVALPTAMHAEAALAAIERGRHLYLEKPLATSVADGRRVVEAWRRSAVTAMMGFNYRRNPLVERARDVIRTGALGSLVAVRTVFSTTARDTPPWKTARGTGGGVLLDLGVHHVDLLRFLTGEEIEDARAELRTVRAEADTAFVRLRLTSGCLAQCFFSSGSVEEDRVEVYGSAAKLTLDRYRSLRVEVTPARAGSPLELALRRALAEWRALPYAVRKLRSPGQEPSYAASLAAFVGAASAGERVAPDLEDGLRAMEVVELAERSVDVAAPAPRAPAPLAGAARDV